MEPTGRRASPDPVDAGGSLRRSPEGRHADPRDGEVPNPAEVRRLRAMTLPTFRKPRHRLDVRDPVAPPWWASALVVILLIAFVWWWIISGG